MQMASAELRPIDDLRRRVQRAALHAAQSKLDEDGDHRFNPGFEPLHRADTLRDAAVLIAVVDRPDAATVIFTKRAETLRAHTGQVAFPGGRIDPGDTSAEAAALREANEEIGLDPSLVEVIGRMPDYVSGSGYRIVPVIGIVHPGFALSLNPTEVDDAFEVPLVYLMQSENHRRESRSFGGREWTYFDIRHGRHRIWGVTAGIVRTLYERLYA